MPQAQTPSPEERPLELVVLPCLSDNYTYLIHDEASGATAVFDVPDAATVREALASRDWALSHILLTHHHQDHVAGVADLREATGAEVWGNAADADRLPPLDRALETGTEMTFAGRSMAMIDVPGHTIGHVAYHLPDEALLFSGDSLMALGCGRLFEGSAAQMHDSLTRLAALPEDTRICSGHEYTLTNARFALGVDPDNAALQDRASRAEAQRAGGEPTVPVRLSLECATNPFLRPHDPGLRAHLGMPDAPDLAVFARLRALRDTF